MEYINIGKEKENFVPRKSSEEFFRDGEVIEELYEWTDSSMANMYGFAYGEYTFKVFNHAYYICWLLINEKGSVSKIHDSILFENDVVQEYSYAVAYALYRLNIHFIPLTHNISRQFDRILSRDFYSEIYCDFMMKKTLSHPINFRVPLPEPIDFVEARDYITNAIEQAIQLQTENKELRKQLESERKQRESLEQIIKSQQEKLDVWESDSFYKAVNINTILKYAQNPENCGENDVKTIKLMLLDLCASKVPADVIKKIKTLICGKIITIENVAQMNTAATEITNHYHPKA